jgi:hypothetical protein
VDINFPDCFALKETVSRDFRPLVFSSNNPTRGRIHALKYFLTSLQIRRDIYEHVWSCAMPHSAGLFCTEPVDSTRFGIVLEHGQALCRLVRDKIAWRWMIWSNFGPMLWT